MAQIEYVYTLTDSYGDTTVTEIKISGVGYIDVRQNITNHIPTLTGLPDDFSFTPGPDVVNIRFPKELLGEFIIVLSSILRGNEEQQVVDEWTLQCEKGIISITKSDYVSKMYLDDCDFVVCMLRLLVEGHPSLKEGGIYNFDFFQCSTCKGKTYQQICELAP